MLPSISSSEAAYCTHKWQNNWIALMAKKDQQINEEKSIVQKRYEDNELRRLKKQEEEMKIVEQKKREEEEQKIIEEKLEQLRKDEVVRMREQARLKEEQIRIKYETANKFIEELQKLLKRQIPTKEVVDPLSKIMIGNKYLLKIQREEIIDGTIDIDDIEKAVEQQFSLERSDRLRIRKIEQRKLEHFIRAIRLEEIPLLNEWSKEIKNSDNELLKLIQKLQNEEDEKDNNYYLEEKDIFEQYRNDIELWRKPLIDNKEKQVRIIST